MSRRLFGCVLVLTIAFVVVGAVASAQVRAVASQDTNRASVGAMKAMFLDHEQRQAALAAIAQDRAAFVAGILSRWSTEIAALDVNDKARNGLQTVLMGADAEKLYNASVAGTYDQFQATLFGKYVGDAAATIIPGEPGPPNALGSASLDLVYTPVNPCRALDTRYATGYWLGPWAANSGRSVQLTDPIIAGQGGLAACGIPWGPTKAVVLNIVAVGPPLYGDLRIYPYGGALPNASILNYSPYQNVANAVVAPICLNCGYDLNIVTDASATDVVVDVLGYFAAPIVTPLDCVTTANTNTSVLAGANFAIDTLACAAGYYKVSANCRSSSYNTISFVSMGPNNGGWDCQGTNTSAGTITMSVSGNCCRVPGR
jgi:hypothetical protein